MNLSLSGLALLLFATTLAAEIPAKQPWHRHQGYGSVGLETTDHALIQTIKPGMTFDRLEAEIGSKPARIPGAPDIALYCTTISEAAYEVAVLDNGTETVLGISYKLLRSAPNASTWSEPRNFHTPFDPDFTERVLVQKAEPAERETETSQVVSSPGKACWFVVVDAETANPVIHVSSGNAANRIIIKDSYANFPVDARWINEKLLFFRIHWGRVIGSDYIFDAELGKIIHREMVHDGTELFRQTNEANRKK